MKFPFWRRRSPSFEERNRYCFECGALMCLQERELSAFDPQTGRHPRYRAWVCSVEFSHYRPESRWEDLA